MSRPSGRGWADRADLTRPTKELARENGVTTSAVTLARRVRGIPNPTPKSKPPPRPRKAPTAPAAPRAPKPPRQAAVRPPAPPKPPKAPRVRPERSSPRESAAVVAPTVLAPTVTFPGLVRAALADEIRGLGSSPFVAAVVVAARYRMALDVVERIAEDVAGMRREVSNG